MESMEGRRHGGRQAELGKEEMVRKGRKEGGLEGH